MKRTQLQAVLAEEGLEHDAALTAALERIAALRLAEPPAPSGELARLLAASSAGASSDRAAQAGEAATAPLAVVLPLTRAAGRKAEAAAAATRPRWIKRHRGAMIGVLVAAGMGLGASGVAAMTGQVWDWHAPLHPAVAPSLTHAAEPSSPGVPAPTGAPAGVPAPPEDAGGAGAGAAAGRTAAGQAADREAGRSVPGRDAGATPGPGDARDQGTQGRDAQEQTPQDRGQQGSGRGPGDQGRPSQGAQQPGDRGSSGQDADGRVADGQDAGR